MDEAKSRKCIDILNAVLKDNVRNGTYYIGSYSEGAVCLEPNENNWIVYYGERNQKSDLCSYDNVLEASIKLIDKISYEYPGLKDVFLEKIFE